MTGDWPAVSIVVVNHNGLQFLDDCFESLRELDYPRNRLEVIMVDNASTDGSPESVRGNHPWVRVIGIEKNLGFAGGANVGWRSGESEFVATLNNDTRVEPTWLRELVGAARSDSQVGMCASKMLFADRPDVINSTGICLDRAGIAWDRRGGEADTEEDGGPVCVFGPSAGAALYRQDMLEEIGGFDEDFFMYLEDVDLAWRAQSAGWRCLYVPRSRVYHIYSATAGEGSAFKNVLLGRNKMWTIIKNYPFPHLLLYLPLIVGLDISAVLYALLKRRQVDALRGRILALSRLSHFLRKRRTVQSLRVITSEEMLSRMSPPEDPFRVRSRYRHLEGLAVTDLARRSR